MKDLESRDVYLPKDISPDESAIVVALLVSNGENVQLGEAILEVETSKSVYQVEAPSEGVVVFHVSEGQFVSPRDKLATLTNNFDEVLTTSSAQDLQVIFTDSAQRLLSQHRLKREEVMQLLSPLRYITSNDIQHLINSNHFEKSERPKVSGILIIGFGHRGRFLHSLLSDKFKASNIEFVDYSKRKAKKRDSQNVEDSKIYLDELIEFDLDDSVHVYWCVPNTVLENEIAFHYNRLSAFIKTFVSDGAWISTNAEISQGTIICPEAVVSPNAKIGQGVFLESGAVVGTNSIVGRFSSLCSNSSLAHDSSLGQFSTLADGSRIAGRVKIGDRVLVGLNATVNADLTIGNNVTIHSGANVYKDLPNDCIFTRDGKLMAKTGP